MTKIAHFFSTEAGSFDTYAEVLDFQVEHECQLETMEVWQCEDGAAFFSEAEARAHVSEYAPSPIDWDGYNMRGVEMFGLLA